MAKELSKEEQQMIDNWLKKNKPVKCPDNYGDIYLEDCRPKYNGPVKFIKDYSERHNDILANPSY